MISTYYLEFSAFLVALFYYRKLKNTFMVWFIPFLLFTSICELSSTIIYENYGTSTYWIFSILLPTTNYFYGFIFFKLINSEKLKNIFFAVALIYLVLNILFVILSEGFIVPLLLISSIMMVILALYYFYRCLLDDVDLNSPIIKSGLWFASGILIFYSGISITFSLFNYIHEHHLNIGGVSLYNFVPRCLSIILYACVSIALIKWKKPQEI